MKSKTQEIYVHIPFCERKCDYCDFVSFVSDDEAKEAYFSMLKKQIELKAEFAGDMPVDSVFFGGGTPSCVKAEYIAETMGVLRSNFKISENAEISMEMNPNSVSRDKLSIYKEAGINRVSMGLQSTDNSDLLVLSRLHSYEEFLKAYEDVRDAGFTNVNIDLMSGLPGQTVDKFAGCLEKVVALNPEHISAYSLIIEEGTAFYARYRDGNGLPDEETDRNIYHFTKDYLSSKGYERYEISNYAKPGYECKHNLGYWIGKNYLGFGPSAASLIGGKRYSMHKSLGAYLKGDFSEEEESLSKEDMMSEFMFLGLRLTKGVDPKDFEERFCCSLKEIYGHEIEKLKKQGLLIEDTRIYLSDLGLDLANMAMAEFV